jgi:hypothetical protein
MKKYILKEYGSWSVMVISYLAGVFASGVFNLNAILSLLAISLFINSKQAFTMWSRRVDPMRSAVIFTAQVVLASLIIIGTLGESVVKLLPYALIPAIYILLLYFAGEHALITEICGFALLTLSSLIAKFVSTGVVDNKLYIAVAVFFIAGVFKVKLQLKRKPFERILMILYIVLAIIIYSLIKLPLIILLPLIDNLIFSVALYNVKLKATGWIEVLKSVIFLALVIIYAV